jgi:hypothetical protein
VKVKAVSQSNCSHTSKLTIQDEFSTKSISLHVRRDLSCGRLLPQQIRRFEHDLISPDVITELNPPPSTQTVTRPKKKQSIWWVRQYLIGVVLGMVSITTIIVYKPR